MNLILKQYQRLQAISKENKDEVIANAKTIEYIFGISTANTLSAEQYYTYISKIKVKRPLFYKRGLFETDAKKLTFGQFIEINEWLKSDIDTVLDKIAASALKERTNHKEDSIRCQNMKAYAVLFSVVDLVNSYTNLVQEFDYLFKDDDEIEGETEAERLRRLKKTHPFLKVFGWQFTAKETADYNNITVSETYKLNIMTALNNMVYLKSLAKYNEWQRKSI